MNNNYLMLDEAEFDARFPLLPNPLNPDATWAFGNGPGCLFETYGEELAFVRAQDERFVWTLIDSDDGRQYVVSGYHWVNRLGYLISTVPVQDGQCIEVLLDQDGP